MLDNEGCRLKTIIATPIHEKGDFSCFVANEWLFCGFLLFIYFRDIFHMEQVVQCNEG